MNFANFEKFRQEFSEKRIKVLDSKGREYANGISRFGNFERIADRTGSNRVLVAYIHMIKHLDAIEYAMKRDRETGNLESSETLESRFIDLINYAELILAMMLEDREIEGKEFRKLNPIT